MYQRDYRDCPEWYRLRLISIHGVPVIELRVHPAVNEAFISKVHSLAGSLQVRIWNNPYYADKIGSFRSPHAGLSKALLQWGFGKDYATRIQVPNLPPGPFVRYWLEIPYVRKGATEGRSLETAFNASVLLGALSGCHVVAMSEINDRSAQLVVVEAFDPWPGEQVFRVWVSPAMTLALSNLSDCPGLSAAEDGMRKAFQRVSNRFKVRDEVWCGSSGIQARNGFLHIQAPTTSQSSLWCTQWRDSVKELSECGYWLRDSLVELPDQQLALLAGLAGVWGLESQT